MLKPFHIPISKQLFAGLLLLFSQVIANAQEETVTDNKGNIIAVRNTIVTTSATAPPAPLQNDIWFDTTAEVTKVYDGSTWLTINLDALAKKEASANKSTDVTLADGTDTKFPTELAVKTYVDGRITATADDDITAVSFDGTNLKVDEGATTFSANLSSLEDDDWYQENSTDTATDINQNLFTMGNVGIGTGIPRRALHVAGSNGIIRLSRSNDTAAMIFDRYSGNTDNTLKSFQFGVNASSTGVGEFYLADYNENISGSDYTRIMTFTDALEVMRFNQYGLGNFTSTNATYLLGVENDGDIVEVDISNYDTDASDDFSGDYNDLTNQPTQSSIYENDGTLTANRVVNGNGNSLSVTNLNGGYNIEGATTGVGEVAANTSDGALLHVKQGNGWSSLGPWALYVEGYSNLNGFRINAKDGRNSLFSRENQLGFAISGNNPITFSQGAGDPKLSILPGGLFNMNEYGLGNVTGTAAYVLGVEADGDLVEIDLSNFDTDASDDFDGDFTSLSNIPTGLSDGDDDNQDLSLSGTILSLTGDATTVNLNTISGPWDNTDGSTADQSSTAIKFNGPVAINKNSNESGYNLDVNGQIAGDIRLKLGNDGVENSHLVIYSSDTETNFFRSDKGNILRLNQSGQLRADSYGNGTFDSSTHTRLLGVESNGNIVEVSPSSGSGGGDSFYEASTTTAPDNINDNIYTQGNVGIGETNPNNTLELKGGAFSLKNPTANYTAVGMDYDETTDNLRFRTNVGGGNLNGDAMVIDRPTRRVGIGTTSPDAQLDIESTGVPLRITPNVTTPSGTQAGQMFMGNDGILYTYDGTRSKWLSVDRTVVGWGASGNITDDYLRQFNGSTSDNNGWRMIRNGTITGISAQTNTSSDWDLVIVKNDGGSPIALLTIISAEGGHANNINVNINEGDYLQAFCSGVNISNPQALIEIAWRK